MNITSNGMSHTGKHLATMWQRRAKAYQIKMAHKHTHTYATHTLAMARSSSKSQLKFLFDLANVSDSAGSSSSGRRHDWTRTDRQHHIAAHCHHAGSSCVYVCVSEKLPASMGTHNADQMPTADEQTNRQTEGGRKGRGGGTDRRHTTVENWLQVESKQWQVYVFRVAVSPRNRKKYR